MSRYYIGIDPGKNTGFAVWDAEARRLVRVETLEIIPALMAVLDYRGGVGDDPVVVFEDARKRTWIPREKNLSEYRGRLMGAGSIKRDCEIWEEFCAREGIRYNAVPPRKGVTKWDADQFKRITGWAGRTSNHARDAALLVFGK